MNRYFLIKLFVKKIDTILKVSDIRIVMTDSIRFDVLISYEEPKKITNPQLLHVNGEKIHSVIIFYIKKIRYAKYFK